MKRKGDITSFFHTKRRDQGDKGLEAGPGQEAAEEEEIWSKAEKVMGSDSRGKERQPEFSVFIQSDPHGKMSI